MIEHDYRGTCEHRLGQCQPAFLAQAGKDRSRRLCKQLLELVARNGSTKGDLVPDPERTREVFEA